MLDFNTRETQMIPVNVYTKIYKKIITLHGRKTHTF